MGTGDRCRVPPAAVRYGRVRQTSGTGPCGDCRRVLWVPGPQDQYSGKIRFIQKPVVQDDCGRHMAKRNSDPRVAYSEINRQVRDVVRVVSIVAPFAPLGADTREKFVLSSPREKMGTGDLCRVPPAAVCHGRARQTSGTGPCGDFRRVLWVPGPRGQYSGKIRFIEKLGVQDEGVAIWLNVVLVAYPEVKLQVRDL